MSFVHRHSPPILFFVVVVCDAFSIRKSKSTLSVLRMGKKRVAKHISAARQAASSTAPSSSSPTKPVLKKKRRKKNKNNHVKDPKEAHSYLSLWQLHQKEGNREGDEDTQLWRFNKNTQSWLLRHMYNIEKIPKGTFSILIQYLKDLKGGSRKRVYEDAVRRALRYKEWEKNHQADEKKNHPEGKTVDAETSNNNNAVEDADDSSYDDEEAEKAADEKRWSRLSDHDKRKEYKRARQVIDVLKSVEKEEK